MAIADTLGRFGGWVGAEVSTLPAALLRVGLALLLWGRHAEAMVLVHAGGVGRGLLSLVFFAASAAMLVGWWSRTATAIAAATVAAAYFGLGANHHHHYLLMMATAMCACTRCGRSLSVDRWRALSRGEAPPERGTRLGLRLMVVQLSSLYFWTALDKTNAAFLDGSRVEQLLGYYYFGSDLPTTLWFHVVCGAAAISVVALEYALAICLWLPRTHRVLLPLGAAFHAGLYIVLPVATFSATAVLLYLAALEPAAVERVFVRLAGRGRLADIQAEAQRHGM